MARHENSKSGARAERELEALFSDHAWKVQRSVRVGNAEIDLKLSKSGRTYVAEIKAGAEGRPDRVLALLSQAILQAQHYARLVRSAKPLAIVHVPVASQQLVKRFKEFHGKYAPEAAVGLVAGNGIRYFAGDGLENLGTSATAGPRTNTPERPTNLFSDLNQWLLKVLLAPEIPERFLAAPRQEYRNASELAAAADVSVMSAFRFVSRLRDEGFLDESRGNLMLVRRQEILRRWQAAVTRSTPELKLVFVLRGSAQSNLDKALSRNNACLGAYAAADRLGLGHVSGVPPYAYVERIHRPDHAHWKGLVAAEQGEAPQLIVKQALAPKSMFRGALVVGGTRISDALQVWLDVATHPSRGLEQAEVLQRSLIQKLLDGS